MVQDRPDLLTVRERPWQQSTLEKVRVLFCRDWHCINLRAVAVAATLVGAVQDSARHQLLSGNRWQFVRYRWLAPWRLVPSFPAPVQLL